MLSAILHYLFYIVVFRAYVNILIFTSEMQWSQSSIAEVVADYPDHVIQSIWFIILLNYKNLKRTL